MSKLLRTYHFIPELLYRPCHPRFRTSPNAARGSASARRAARAHTTRQLRCFTPRIWTVRKGRRGSGGRGGVVLVGVRVRVVLALQLTHPFPCCPLARTNLHADGSSYTICDGSGEDNSCSNGQVDLSASDHCDYFGGICGTCCK